MPLPQQDEFGGKYVLKLIGYKTQKGLNAASAAR